MVTPAQPEQEMRDRAERYADDQLVHLRAKDVTFTVRSQATAQSLPDLMAAFAQQEVERRTREIVADAEDGNGNCHPLTAFAERLRAKYKLTEQGERG